MPLCVYRPACPNACYTRLDRTTCVDQCPNLEHRALPYHPATTGRQDVLQSASKIQIPQEQQNISRYPPTLWVGITGPGHRPRSQTTPAFKQQAAAHQRGVSCLAD